MKFEKVCKFFVGFLSLVLFVPVFCLAKINEKNEKAVWITTVCNLDWPKTISQESQKEELTDMLDNLEKHGFNRVYFQVRTRGEAFYESYNFSWSSFLTGELGKNPGYDPLRFMVDECAKRKIVCEAWINPFLINSNKEVKFSVDNYMEKLPENSKLKGHKDWIMSTDENYYLLNPGIPEVREIVAEECEYIAKTYKVAIHMDDYFYPYPSDVKFKDYDAKEYELYHDNNMSIDDWRRDNINQFVELVSSKVRNQGQTFGISPFGIWKNVNGTNGCSSYYDLYADSKLWLDKVWIDYIVPQIYWEIGHERADFETLVKWWNDVNKSHKAKLLIGMAFYKFTSNTDEIKKQVDMLEKLDNVDGFAAFRYEHLNEIFEKRIM